jgi:hypothetical protein
MLNKFVESIKKKMMNAIKNTTSAMNTRVSLVKSKHKKKIVYTTMNDTLFVKFLPLAIMFNYIGY